MNESIKIRRKPGTCCPEPTCDNRTATRCQSCGADCISCRGWISLKKQKPMLKQEILVFEQGYDRTGKHYWSHYCLAIYDIDYNDRRRKAFYPSLEYRVRSREDGSTMDRIWQERGITHWQPLPDPPDKISPEEYAKLAGYEYEK
jgi:hypothetical protein